MPNVSLFVPCYVDQMMPEIGFATASVLKKTGCSVEVPAGQTCCGQPPFNSGYCNESRCIAEHFLHTFADSEFIVAPSGSCVNMVRNDYLSLFEGTDLHQQAIDIGKRTYELCEFLVDVLEITDLGAHCDATVTWHDGCHGMRGLGIDAQPRKLLENVKGLTFIEMKEAKTCCGFGGTFAIKCSDISCAMAQVKCESATEVKADLLVSADPSCLMHLNGYADKQKIPLNFRHISQILDS